MCKLRLQQVGMVDQHAAGGTLDHLHDVRNCLSAGNINIHLNISAEIHRTHIESTTTACVY